MAKEKKITTTEHGSNEQISFDTTGERWLGDYVTENASGIIQNDAIKNSTDIEIKMISLETFISQFPYRPSEFRFIAPITQAANTKRNRSTDDEFYRSPNY